MTNKTKAKLPNIGIIATVVLVSTILLKLSLKDNSVKIAPAPVSTAAARANRGIVNPNYQIAENFKEGLANPADVLSENDTGGITNALEPFWTISRTTDDTVVADALFASDSMNGVSGSTGYSGGQSSTDTTTLTGGGGAGGSGGGGGGGGSGGGAANEPADSDAETSETSTSGGGSTDTVPDDQSSASVIVLSSLEKVLQDDVNVSGAEEAEIFCAKNEYESFQIIVVNPTDTTISQINLKAYNWHFTDTPGEGAPELTLYREHYIKTEKPSYTLESKPGMYPDALIPFIDPYTGEEITTGKYLARNQDIEPHKNQGYWVDIHVGSNVKAGTYTNEIEVLAGGQVIKRIPVKLTVWDFTLPKQRKFITYMYGFYDIAQYYGNPKGAAYRTLYDRCRDMVYEHGIYPVFQLPGNHYTKQAEATKEGLPAGTVTFLPLYYSNMKTFISKYGTGIIQIPPSWFIKNYEVPSKNSIPTRTEVKRTLQCYNDLSKAHPEYGQYVVYLDEPWLQNRKDAVRVVKDIMNEIPDLKLKMLLTGSQYAFDILDSAGDRCADIWVCYGQNIINDHTHVPSRGRSLEDLAKDFLDDSTDKILWTNSTNGFIDASLSAYRDFAWYGYTLGATGAMNWRSTLPWTVGVDAWVEARTHTNPKIPDRVYNGAYFFIYPGNPDRVGISGIGGPIASMRLKTWRKACEDFEYFKILEELTNKATVDAIVSSVVYSYYTCADPEDYETARKTIAELILKHLKNN